MPPEKSYDIMRWLLQSPQVRELANGTDGGLVTEYRLVRTIFGSRYVPARQFEICKTGDGEFVREYEIKRGIFKDKRVLIEEFRVKSQ